MEQEDFPSSAVAMRRQLALLHARTYTDERRKVTELILRLSYDCQRLEVAVPSQEWIARQEGIHESNVSKVLSALRAFGWLRQRRGADGWILFEPRPDSAEWGGLWRDERLRWRIEDRAARQAVLDEEMRLAGMAHPGSPAQILLDYQVEPTIREEYQEALASTHRQEAREQAGFLPEPDPDPSAEERPRRDFAGLKASIAGRVGASAHVPADPLGSPAKSDEPTWFTNQVQSPAGSTELGSPANPERKPVGWPAKKLVGQPTCPPTHLVGQPSRPRVSAPVPARPSPISPSPSGLQPTSSPISPCAEMDGRDAACAAENIDGQMGQGSLPERVRALVGELRWHQWQRWLRWELGKPGGREAALDAFGELKIQLDLAAHGHRQPIHTPGAWWLSKFRRLAGHQRSPPSRMAGTAASLPPTSGTSRSPRRA